MPDWSTIGAVVFDAYGTLVRRISRGPDPLRQMFHARHPAIPATELGRVVRENRSFDAWAKDWQVTPAERAHYLDELKLDLLAVLAYPEASRVLKAVRASGRQVVLCSNLAPIYLVPVQQQLGHGLQHVVASFEVGAVKPEPAIYQAILAKTQLPPAAHLFVGDRLAEDVEGPRAAGFQAIQVVRPGQKGPTLEQPWTDLTPLLDLPPYPGRSVVN